MYDQVLFLFFVFLCCMLFIPSSNSSVHKKIFGVHKWELVKFVQLVCD